MSIQSNTAIEELCEAIHGGALVYIEELKKRLGLFKSDDTFEQRMGIYLECVLLFLHISNRIAYNMIEEKHISGFQKQLSKQMLERVQSFFISNLSQNKRIINNLTDLFYNDLNDREILYGNCKEFSSKEKSFSGNSISSRFSIAVSQILNEQSNPEVLVTIIEIVSEFNPFNVLEELVIKSVEKWKQ